MTARRWWLLLAAVAGVEAGCMVAIHRLAMQNPNA